MHATPFGNRTAIVLLWFLVFTGVLSEVFVVPSISSGLASDFIEYSGDAALIQALLTAIVLTGQFVFAIVALLLGKIRRGVLLEYSSLKFVRLLTAGFVSGIVCVGALMTWLYVQNTMPPALAMFLLVSIIVGWIFALVSNSLLRVLQLAIANRAELEGVI